MFKWFWTISSLGAPDQCCWFFGRLSTGRGSAKAFSLVKALPPLRTSLNKNFCSDTFSERHLLFVLLRNEISLNFFRLWMVAGHYLNLTWSKSEPYYVLAPQVQRHMVFVNNKRTQSMILSLNNESSLSNKRTRSLWKQSTLPWCQYKKQIKTSQFLVGSLITTESSIASLTSHILRRAIWT